MCGRYTIPDDPDFLQALKEAGLLYEDMSYVRLMTIWRDVQRKRRYNIAPAETAELEADLPIIRDVAPHDLILGRWGLIPPWCRDPAGLPKLSNARSDGVASKPSFRAAFKSRRCLIPADGFYEWRGPKGAKIPYRITLKDGKLFTFAGLWEEWQGAGLEQPVITFTLITTEPNELMAHIHDRMPVILPPEKREEWLSKDTPPEKLQTLLVPFPSAQMRAYPVSKKVNVPKIDDPSLLEPVEGQVLDGSDPNLGQPRAVEPPPPRAPKTKAKAQKDSAQGELF